MINIFKFKFFMFLFIASTLFSNLNFDGNIFSTNIYASNFRAPNFQATLSNGESFELANQKGKVVLLNFFSTTCKYCLQELPHIKELYEEYGENKDDVIFISVMNPKTAEYPYASDVDMDQVKKFLVEKDSQIPVIFNPSGNILDSYRISGFPTNFIIDKNGDIFKYMPGAVGKDLLSNLINEAISK